MRLLQKINSILNSNILGIAASTIKALCSGLVPASLKYYVIRKGASINMLVLIIAHLKGRLCACNYGILMNCSLIYNLRDVVFAQKLPISYGVIVVSL